MVLCDFIKDDRDDVVAMETNSLGVQGVASLIPAVKSILRHFFPCLAGSDVLIYCMFTTTYWLSN